jgi:site-specific recombinase XerD
MDDLSAESLGVSAGRLSNIRSLLLKSIALVRPVLPGRQTIPLLPAWQVLIDRLATQTARVRIAPPLRWLSEQGIGPDTLKEEDLLRYRDQLLAGSLRADPEKSWHAFLWQWNAAVREVSGFPQIPLHRESRKKSVTLAWTCFPVSLYEDTAVWLDELSGKDLLAEGPIRPVKASTVETREYQIRYFASALVDAGVDPQSLKTLADLVSLANFETGLRHLYQRNGNKASSTLGNLGGALIAIARNYVLPRLSDDVAAEATLKRMRFLVSRVDKQSKGLTDKNHDRLLQLENPEQVHKLVTLPQRLKAEALSGKHPHSQSLVLADMAVAIELLLMTAIRIGNLQATKLDINLKKYRNRYILTYAQDEVKNSNRLQFDLPDETCRLIDWYLTDIRPQRLKGPSDYLFIGEDGTSAKAKNTLAGQISKTVKDYTGLTMNPHLFRHAMAYIYLNENPGGYQVMRLILGHKSLNTTVSAYSGAETKSAQAHFDKLVYDLRDRHQPTTKRRSKR